MLLHISLSQTTASATEGYRASNCPHVHLTIHIQETNQGRTIYELVEEFKFWSNTAFVTATLHKWTCHVVYVKQAFLVVLKKVVLKASLLFLLLNRCYLSPGHPPLPVLSPPCLVSHSPCNVILCHPLLPFPVTSISTAVLMYPLLL